MTDPTTRASIQDEISRIEFLVAQVGSEGFDEHVVDLAQEHLSEVKAAAQPVLRYDEHFLGGLIAENRQEWVQYRAKVRAASAFLGPLV